MAKTHGHSCGNQLTKTYRTWNGMMMRCYNVNHESFNNWGGRGITVCDRWHKFENFLADVGEIEEGLSVDRIDNDGNYELSNVRFVDARTQARNKRSTFNITIDGKTQCLQDWADQRSIDPNTLAARVRRGMIGDDLFAEPGCKPKLVTIDGETKTLTDWAKIANLPINTVRSRLLRGMTGSDLIAKASAIKDGKLSYVDKTFYTLNGETKSLREWSDQYGHCKYKVKKRLERGWGLEDALSTL